MARFKNSKDKPLFLSELWKHLGFENKDSLEKHRASLFPVRKNTDENHATSIFLSSLSVVKEYREELFTRLGIKDIKNKFARLHVYTEIPCHTRDDKDFRPDGLIVLTSGIIDPEIHWMSFVEAKIEKNDIEVEQIKNYIECGKELDIKNIITISNQLRTTPKDSPVDIDLRSAKNFNLYHWSWIYLSVTAGRLLNANKVKDEDHKYILSELRRYFNNNRPNIKDYSNMEKSKKRGSWSEATKKFHENSKAEKWIDNIVKSYIQEEKDIALQLMDDEGYDIRLKISTNTDREKTLENMLKKNQTISSKYYINGNKSHFFTIETGFISRLLTCKTTYKIPTGKAKNQTTQLINILTKNDIVAEDQIKIKAIYSRKNNNNDTNITTLKELLEERDNKRITYYSFLDKQQGDRVSEFEISINRDLGYDFHNATKIVKELENLAKQFFKTVFINLK